MVFTKPRMLQQLNQCKSLRRNHQQIVNCIYCCWEINNVNLVKN